MSQLIDVDYIANQLGVRVCKHPADGDIRARRVDLDSNSTDSVELQIIDQLRKYQIKGLYYCTSLDPHMPFSVNVRAIW